MANHADSAMRNSWAANLILPGAGLILLGRVWSGLFRGVVFAVCANLVILALFIIPAEVSRGLQALIVGVTVGVYVGAQLRYAHALRERHDEARAAERRTRLESARRYLAEGDAIAALESLVPIADDAEHDLVVAFRLAQALTAAGDVDSARVAWRRVRQLDRHGIYRAQVRENERNLSAGRVL